MQSKLYFRWRVYIPLRPITRRDFDKYYRQTHDFSYYSHFVSSASPFSLTAHSLNWKLSHSLLFSIIFFRLKSIWPKFLSFYSHDLSSLHDHEDNRWKYNERRNMWNFHWFIRNFFAESVGGLFGELVFLCVFSGFIGPCYCLKQHFRGSYSWSLSPDMGKKGGGWLSSLKKVLKSSSNSKELPERKVKYGFLIFISFSFNCLFISC